MSAPGFSRPARCSGNRAEQRRGGVAAGIRQQPRRLDRVELELGQSVGHAGRQRLPSPDRTCARARVVAQAKRARQIDHAQAARQQRRRQLRRRRFGQRQEDGVCRRTPPRSSGTTVPSQIFASDGRRRGVLVACEPVAAVMVTWGWRASRRISSWPAKPVAPATATRTGRAGRSASIPMSVSWSQLSAYDYASGRIVIHAYFSACQQKIACIIMHFVYTDSLGRINMKARRQSAILDVVEHEAGAQPGTAAAAACRRAAST